VLLLVDWYPSPSKSMLSALFATHDFDERINIGSDQLEQIIKRYDPDQLPFAAHDG